MKDPFHEKRLTSLQLRTNGCFTVKDVHLKMVSLCTVCLFPAAGCEARGIKCDRGFRKAPDRQHTGDPQHNRSARTLLFPFPENDISLVFLPVSKAVDTFI